LHTYIELNLTAQDFLYNSKHEHTFSTRTADTLYRYCLIYFPVSDESRMSRDHFMTSMSTTLGVARFDFVHSLSFEKEYKFYRNVPVPVVSRSFRDWPNKLGPTEKSILDDWTPEVCYLLFCNVVLRLRIRVHAEVVSTQDMFYRQKRRNMEEIVTAE
jgi:hypothetical protein